MNKKIQAIKNYKHENSCSLLEAKIAIEATGLFPRRVNQGAAFVMVSGLMIQQRADGEIIFELARRYTD